MTRYALMLVLFVLAVGIPARFDGPAPAHAAPAAPVPDAVHSAAEDGRYWRASRLMGDYLATVRDTTPQHLLLAARLHAGWDDWATVGDLLEGREWLDTRERGAGWELVGRSRVAAGRPAEGAVALARFLDRHPMSDRETGVAELRLALAHAAADSAAAALIAFDRAARYLPWLADRVALLAAEAAASVGDTAALRVRLAAAGDLAGDAWRLRLRALTTAGDSMAARELALETGRTAGSASVRAAAFERLGALRLADGDTVRARAAYAEALEAPGTVSAVDAARSLSELEPTPEQWRRIADVYARHGNAARAAEGYGAWLDSGAGTAAERAEIRLRRGRARYNAGRYREAERELLALAAEAGVSPQVGAAALYYAGRSQYRQGRSGDGQRTLARMPAEFPGPTVVAEGLYLLADLKHDDQELADARRYYRAAAEAAPAVEEAGLALMRLAGLDMLEGDHAAAAAIYEDYRRLHPDGRRWNQATYWAARAYAAMDRPAEARSRLRALRERDPLSYYGVQAAELLDEPLLAIEMGQPPAPDSAAEALVRDGLRRVDVLAELDRRDDLVNEVERLRDAVDGHPAAEYALAEALTERGYTLTAIGMGWDLFRRKGEWNDRLLRIIYPFPFRSLVLPESDGNELDPYLVAGLIRRESAFNPSVTSSAGAIGLMQIMPETGRSLAREMGIDDFQPELLKQPEVNVILGTRFLATVLEQFDRDLPLVLSAYNAGPTRAVRWRELPEARDPELFTERIPYGETRDYVRNVLLHRALYRALYPDLEADTGS